MSQSSSNSAPTDGLGALSEKLRKKFLKQQNKMSRKLEKIDTMRKKNQQIALQRMEEKKRVMTMRLQQIKQSMATPTQESTSGYVYKTSNSTVVTHCNSSVPQNQITYYTYAKSPFMQESSSNCKKEMYNSSPIVYRNTAVPPSQVTYYTSRNNPFATKFHQIPKPPVVAHCSTSVPQNQVTYYTYTKIPPVQGSSSNCKKEIYKNSNASTGANSISTQQTQVTHYPSTNPFAPQFSSQKEFYKNSESSAITPDCSSSLLQNQSPSCTTEQISQEEPELQLAASLNSCQIDDKGKDNKIDTDSVPSNLVENSKSDIAEDLTCVICFEEQRQYMFFDCRHFCICETCAQNYRVAQNSSDVQIETTCPQCRTLITKNPIKIFM